MCDSDSFNIHNGKQISWFKKTNTLPVPLTNAGSTCICKDNSTNIPQNFSLQVQIHIIIQQCSNEMHK